MCFKDHDNKKRDTKVRFGGNVVWTKFFSFNILDFSHFGRQSEIFAEMEYK